MTHDRKNTLRVIARSETTKQSFHYEGLLRFARNDRCRWFSGIIRQAAIFFIRVYQRGISPLFPPRCRHFPSCSQYTIEAIESYGFLKGSFLGGRRILSCHPFGKSGYDPVPLKEHHPQPATRRAA